MRSKTTLALLPWSDLIEDYLDDIGVSLETFCTEMTGGWLFGYVEALRTVGVRTVVVCFSGRLKNATRFTHRSTGTTFWVLPAGRGYLRLRDSIVNPYGRTVGEVFGEEVQGFRRGLLSALKAAAPYLATPLRALRHVLRRERCDLILCQGYEYARFDVCVMLGRLLGLPVFATFQGGDWQLSRLEGLLRPLSLRACAGLVIAPHTEADRVRARYGMPARKIARIFNPLDLSQWKADDRSAARAALGIPPEARVAVWHGRVDVPRKGLDILLDAWEHVCAAHPGHDLRLLLVGTGRDADLLRRRLAALDAPGVRWIDEYVLDRAVLRRYLSAADVYVFPSRHEGFPVAPIEAMACGLPVVAADAQGVPDILEDGEASGGLVVPREDPEALARALGPLLTDPARCRAVGARARRRVETAFSLDAVGRQLRTFFSERGVV